MARDEPCCFDAVFGEEFQETFGPYRSGPDSCVAICLGYDGKEANIEYATYLG